MADLAACLAEPELSDAAAGALWAVFSRHPDAEVALMMQQGVAFVELGQLPLALEAFEAACKRAPSFAEVCVWRGRGGGGGLCVAAGHGGRRHECVCWAASGCNPAVVAPAPHAPRRPTTSVQRCCT
jgi:hypothetical protein